MFDFSFGELVFLTVIALIVVGPEKLPEVVRTAGKWYGRLRRAMTSVRSEMEQHLLLDDFHKEANDWKNLANEALLPEDLVNTPLVQNGMAEMRLPDPSNLMAESRQDDTDIGSELPDVYGNNKTSVADHVH